MSSLQALDDYLKSKRYKDGLNQCARLLKKSNRDPLVHLYKARFLSLSGLDAEADAVIKSLTTGTIAITDSKIAEDIDTFLWERNLDSTYPPPLTNGPDSASIWNTLITSTRRTHHADICRDRLAHAIMQERWIDASHALLALRKIDASNKDLRSLHATVYQMIADATTDAMPVKLNSQLADRTLQQVLGPDPAIVEIILMVKILRRQKAYARVAQLTNDYGKIIRMDHLCTAELIEVMKEGKLYDALFDFLQPKFAPLFDPTIEDDHDAAQNPQDAGDYRVLEAWVLAVHHRCPWEDMAEYLASGRLRPGTTIQMAKIWTMRLTESWDCLVQACEDYFYRLANLPSCYPMLKPFVLALPPAHQRRFLDRTSAILKSCAEELHHKDPATKAWVSCEANCVRFEYLLTIANNPQATLDDIYAFIHNLLRLLTFDPHFGGAETAALVAVYADAFERAAALADTEKHLVLGLSMMQQRFAEHAGADFFVKTMRMAEKLGLYNHALVAFNRVSAKEIQMETISHFALTRISIKYPTGKVGSNPEATARAMLVNTLKMYPKTTERLANSQANLVESERFDLLLDLQDLRSSLTRSLNRRILILELRRLDRLNDTPPSTEFSIRPPMPEMWLEDLQDNRDSTSVESFDQLLTKEDGQDRSSMTDPMPGAAWLRYHLWIDEVCSLSYGQSLLSRPYLDADAATASLQESPDLTTEEKTMVPFWKVLATASTHILPQVTLATDAAAIKKTESALQNICTSLDILAVLTKKAIPAIDADRSFPTSAVVQLLFLQMDFLKAVERFVLAATSKFKQAKISQHNASLSLISKRTRDHWMEIREYATKRMQATSSQKFVTANELLLEKIMHSRPTEKPKDYDVEGALRTGLQHLSFWEDPARIQSDGFVVNTPPSLAKCAVQLWQSVLSIKMAT